MMSSLPMHDRGGEEKRHIPILSSLLIILIEFDKPPPRALMKYRCISVRFSSFLDIDLLIIQAQSIHLYPVFSVVRRQY